MTEWHTTAHTASLDQATAQIADLGRGWAAMYVAMVAAGMPRRLAARLVDRQHAAACQTQVLTAVATVGQGAP